MLLYCTSAADKVLQIILASNDIVSDGVVCNVYVHPIAVSQEYTMCKAFATKIHVEGMRPI